MKIAIHHRQGSFSDCWIDYCKQENINYKIVNCFDNNIIKQVKDCDALLWHYHHSHFKDTLIAKQILFALEHAGIKVFPDFKTGWHFDDKVAQKYLLEAIEAPLVPSYVFYEKEKALDWIKKTDFPKVWKLKGGAGAENVQLIHSKKTAARLTYKAFGKGFSQFNRWGYIKERYRKYKKGNIALKQFLKSTARLIIPRELAKMAGREKGYIYFQEFIPNNDFDIRLVIINNRVFGCKRIVRKNDFRASGSGVINFNKEEIDIRCVKKVFEINEKLQTQSLTFDFIFDKENTPLIVEISYGFTAEPYQNCPGYWDKDINWHKGKFNPLEWMVEEIISKFALKS